jgi:tetratricopeptide (TPR) repeat protein
VLTGTVQWEETPGKDAKVRVSPELVRVADTSSVWAHGYDAVLTSVFQVYSDVSTQVAGALQVALDDPEKQNLARRPTANAEAYDLYLRAVDLSNRGLAADNFNASIPMLQRAVALDPQFALAWGRLSEQMSLAHWLYVRRNDSTLAQATAAAERALQLQPDLPEAHRAMGNIWYRKRDYAKALAEFAIVQRSQPNSADLLASIGYVERRQGRWPEALGHLQQARDLDPGSAQAISQVGQTLGIMGRYDEAFVMYRRGIELAPGEPDSYVFMAINLLGGRGDIAGAREVLRAASRRMTASRLLVGLSKDFAFVVAPDDSLTQSFQHDLTRDQGFAPGRRDRFLADLLLARGDTVGAGQLYLSARNDLLAQLRHQPDDYGYLSELGIVEAHLGHVAEAIRAGTRAVELLPPERDTYFGVVNVVELARTYALLGQGAAAAAQLRRAWAFPAEFTAAALRVDPDFASILGDPAIRQLLEGAH